MYKTYIFDLDGTLLDTLDDLTTSVNYALRMAGLPEKSLDEVRAFVGNGVRKLMVRSVPGGDQHVGFEKILSLFREYYSQHDKDKTRPYPGIIEMLKTLKSRGARIAVVSNKFNTATQSLCKYYFGELVEVAVGEHDGVKKKPAPDIVNEALGLLGVDREDAVYVGDSDVDIMTARNSGLPCISVLWGFRNRSFLENSGARIFVNTPEELISIND